MKRKIFIYQIYYSKETRSKLDLGFIPLDNTENQRPDWREFWCIKSFFDKNKIDNENFYGFFSPKLFDKTGLTSSSIYNFINQNHESIDIFLFNPIKKSSFVFFNVIDQAVDKHKSITFDSPGSKPIIERAIEKNLFTGKVTTPIEELATHSKIYNAKHNLINITNKHLGKTTMVLPGKKTELSPSEEWASYLYNFAKQKVAKYLGINGIVEGFEEIISGISKHGLVNFSDLKQNITLTVDDWEAEIQKYAENTLNLKNNLYTQIVETETGANLVEMYNGFQSCSQEYAQEVKTTGDISNYHLVC